MILNRFWRLEISVVLVAVIIAGWIFGINPQLSELNATAQEREAVSTDLAKNRATLAELEADPGNIGEIAALLADLVISIPPRPAIPVFISQVNAMANQNQLKIKSISVGEARPFLKPTEATLQDEGIKDSAKVIDGLINSKFILIPIEIRVLASYQNVLRFVNDLQLGPRLFLVTSFASATSSLTADSNSTGMVDSKLSGFIFVIPEKKVVAAK